jgi:hypothetical protein
MSDASERSIHKPISSQVKKGDLHRFTYYAKVEENSSRRDGERQLKVVDVDRGGEPFGVSGDSLIISSQSADQVHEEVKWPLTKVAQFLMDLDRTSVFTANFDKQDGENRTIHGRLLPSPETSLGRSMCEDLDMPGPTEKRIRQIDRRTLHWLIVDGVKYAVK